MEKKDTQCLLTESSRKMMESIAHRDWNKSACELCVYKEKCKK
jgi:hypothetical protein